MWQTSSTATVQRRGPCRRDSIQAKIERGGDHKCRVLLATPSEPPPGGAGDLGNARSVLLARQLVVDALDVEIHAEDLAVGEIGAALALDLLAVLPNDRALEWVQLARCDCGLCILGDLLHIVGHVG